MTDANRTIYDALRLAAGRMPPEETGAPETPPAPTSPVDLVRGADIDAGVRGGEPRPLGGTYMNEVMRKAARRPLDPEW